METNGSCVASYNSTALELEARIRALAEKDARVYNCKSTFDLFDLGLKCDDLQPSLAQASWALGRVKQGRPTNPTPKEQQ